MSFKYLDPTGVGYFWYKIKSLVSTKYTKPDTGIPKSDLESSVQTTLTNADTVVTNFSNKIDKVNGATAGNIAILNATGSITDGNTSIQNVELNVDTNGHTYVDLGLPSGTLWATCNVGATNPEDYGNYYAWGETQTKQEYSWNTYQHGSSGSNITKYNATDGKTELEPDDDVCHIVMGGDWKMPTEVQCRELIANTTYTWTTINGITGILLTSTVNNNTLFIPASGYINNTSITDLTIQSCIWSSNLYIHETYGIMGVSELSYRETGSLITVSNDRYKGYPCRGVINKSGIEFKQDKTIMPVKTTASAVEFPDGETALSKVSDLEENKVDKVSGKSLSTNDYTTEDKTKLSNIASGAQVNVLETVKVNDNPLTITNKSVNIDLSNYAQKDGSYSGMTVGAAEDLVSAESVASEFTSRITGGSTAVGKGGTALVDKIKGRTLVWNQLVNNGNFRVIGGWSTVRCDYTISESVATVNVAANERNGYIYQSCPNLVIGHKYYVHGEVKGSGANMAVVYVERFATGSKYTSTANTWEELNRIVTAVDTRGAICASNTDSSNPAYFRNLMIIDLTLMFGAGNEPSTPEEFEALYPGPYYGYNPGTLVSNAATAIETVGWNIWDEEWEAGMINPTDGTDASSNTQIRSSYIPVFGGADYFFPTKTYIVCTYDANKKFLSRIKYSTDGVTRTLDNNAAYLRFCTYTDYGTTYKNDICISLSDPSRNGTYEPYWRSQLELGLGDIKVKSHNLWDEEWEAGGIDATTGQNDSTSNIIRAKNYTPVTGGQSYYIYMGSASASQAISMRYYDANKNLIGTTDKNGSSNGANLVRVMPDSCAYIRFITSSYYGSSTTYLNDICINLSDPAFNGRYEPYGDGGVISITGGLKSAGTVYDEISGGKLVKRIESVDLGTLTWSVCELPTDPNGFRAPFAYSISDAICAKYPCVKASSSAQWVTPNTLYYGHFNYTGYGIIITASNTTYATAATFKASLSGVTLYYELAQPIEYELADAIPTAMRNDPYGTERRLPEDTAAIVTAPFRADITYSTNIKEAVQSLPQNYINVNSMQDFLAKLGEAINGTWRMEQKDGKFTFTFTENEQPVL